MIGQSNMAGRGFINEVPMICNERIQMLRNGKWQMMTEPINYDRPISGVSLAGSFAAMCCMENKEEQIGLIPCAEGGSCIDDWSIEKILFKNAIIQAKFAMQNSNLIAILWHQGESDRAYGDKYYENLKAVVAYVRNHLSEKTGEDYSKLPFIFGTVARKNKQYGSEVEEAIKRLAKEDKNAYLIDMSDAELMGDRLHFNQNSAEYLGKQMYEQIKKLR